MTPHREALRRTIRVCIRLEREETDEYGDGYNGD